MPGTVTCSVIKQPGVTTVEGNTIRLYYGKTGDLLPAYHQFYALLDDVEKLRAARYYNEADRQRFVVQHGALRVLLGQYLSKAPVMQAYAYNANKKPYLANTSNCFFNLSHSKGEFLIAIGPKEMGVDIEHINPGFEFQGIASTWFSKTEEAFINEAANPTQVFFLLWTRKEALLKACGTGIDDNLPLMPALNGSHPLPASYADVNWLTQSFKLNGAGFMASVTYPSPQTNISFEQLNITGFDLD